MAVLAMLKLPNHRNLLYLHAPAQPIMPPEQQRYTQAAVDLTYAITLNREEKREMVTERLKQQK